MESSFFGRTALTNSVFALISSARELTSAYPGQWQDLHFPSTVACVAPSCPQMQFGMPISRQLLQHDLRGVDRLADLEVDWRVGIRLQRANDVRHRLPNVGCVTHR